MERYTSGKALCGSEKVRGEMCTEQTMPIGCTVNGGWQAQWQEESHCPGSGCVLSECSMGQWPQSVPATTVFSAVGAKSLQKHVAESDSTSKIISIETACRKGGFIEYRDCVFDWEYDARFRLRPSRKIKVKKR